MSVSYLRTNKLIRSQCLEINNASLLSRWRYFRIELTDIVKIFCLSRKKSSIVQHTPEQTVLTGRTMEPLSDSS